MNEMSSGVNSPSGMIPVDGLPIRMLSRAQRCFVDAVCEVLTRAGRQAYASSCYKDESGNGWCRPSHRGYALFVCAEAVRADFRDKYLNGLVTTPQSTSEIAWDVFYVWRMIRIFLKKSRSETAFWGRVHRLWIAEMNMWWLHPEIYFIDCQDPCPEDSSMHPDWNWYTQGPRRLRRFV